MKRYLVTIPIFASTTIEVQTKSKIGAINKASDEAHVSVCHQCAREINIGDLDWDNAEADEVEP
jgi:hypothetical protein